MPVSVYAVYPPVGCKGLTLLLVGPVGLATGVQTFFASIKLTLYADTSNSSAHGRSNVVFMPLLWLACLVLAYPCGQAFHLILLRFVFGKFSSSHTHKHINYYKVNFLKATKRSIKNIISSTQAWRVYSNVHVNYICNGIRNDEKFIQLCNCKKKQETSTGNANIWRSAAQRVAINLHDFN